MKKLNDVVIGDTVIGITKHEFRIISSAEINSNRAKAYNYLVF